ncbi:MAG: hypothetical protein Q9227_007414 [Pyrenula ochraceoflavens]
MIKQHGCKPAWSYPHKDPFGLDMVLDAVRAAKQHKFLQNSRQRYLDTGRNTMYANPLGRPGFNTCEPEIVKAVLSTKFNDFGLGPRRSQVFVPFLGAGIFDTDGAAWEHSRALIRPNFTRSQVADLETFELHVSELIDVIPKDGSTFDLQELFFKLTIDSATEFLFDPDSAKDFVEGFTYGTERMARIFQSGMALLYVPDKRWRQSRKAVWHFVDKIVDEAIRSQKNRDVEKSPDDTRYVFLYQLVKETSDPYVLRSETLNVLLAGRDTTASLLSNTWHVLARRPDIWAKLRSDVDKLNGAKPTYEQIKDMKYLKYVLNESLRLMPVVPGNGRMAMRDTVLPVGGGEDGKSPLFVPKGHMVNYSVYSMHRRPDIYGPDAEEFKPERWEKLRPSWEYLPFNGGPRICLGQQFALAEASYTTIRLIQAFSKIEPRDEREWCEWLTLTMASGVGCNVALTPA